MKYFLTYTLIMSFVSNCYTLSASENTRCEVNEYNEARDSQLRMKLMLKKHILLGYEIDPAVEGSHTRCVLMAKIKTDTSYVGFTSFFVNKDNIDAVQINDGYIEMLLVDDNTKQQGINLLLNVAVGHLEKHLYAQRAAVLFLEETRPTTDKGYIAVQKTNFIAQPQTVFEKERKLIRYEKPFKN